MNECITTSKSWKIHDMPAQRVHIPVNRIIPFEDMKLIMRGFKPLSMEDKWFMYCDECNIRIFRSWTGFCIYISHFESFKTDYILTTLAVNNDNKQYIKQSDEKEVERFFDLLDSFRERRRVPPVITPHKIISPSEELRHKFINDTSTVDEHIKTIK